MVATRTTHVRYLIVLRLFAASTFSYGDRMVLSIAATDISRDLHLNALRLGYLFSAFSWAYAAQLPAGSLLDRFGSRPVYGISIVCWSCSAFLSGFAGCSPAAVAFCILLPLRLLSGRAQSPGFRGTDASWPRGFLPQSVAAPLRSSIHRSTFYW